MRKLKKCVSVILSVAMLSALGGCSSGNPAPADTAAPANGAQSNSGNHQRQGMARPLPMSPWGIRVWNF